MLEVPGRRIGHFGFFRVEMASCLWPRALAVLERWRCGESQLTPKGQPSAGSSSTFSRMARSTGAVDNQPGQGELFSENP